VVDQKKIKRKSPGSLQRYDPADWGYTPSEDLRITLKMIPIVLVLILGFALGLTTNTRSSAGTAGKLMGAYAGTHRTELENAYSFIVTEDYSSAVSMASAVLDEDPDNALAFHIIGLAYARRGLAEEAVRSFESAVDLEPDFALAWYGLGVVDESRGEFSRALVAYRNAVRSAPGDARFLDAASRVENIVIGEGGWDWTESEAEKLFLDGITAVNRGGPDDLVFAENTFRALLNVRPYDVATRNMLGLTLAKQGSLEEAETILLEVVELEPGFSDAWFNLGMLHRVQGRLEEALDDFETAYSTSTLDSFRENARREADSVRSLLEDEISLFP